MALLAHSEVFIAFGGLLRPLSAPSVLPSSLGDSRCTLDAQPGSACSNDAIVPSAPVRNTAINGTWTDGEKDYVILRGRRVSRIAKGWCSMEFAIDGHPGEIWSAQLRILTGTLHWDDDEVWHRVRL